ncbi:hypothetical protein Ani05nite_54920 [Amorphoplanes nipponensis]|uniref:Uncharacterized protein n=1 Tax=Actinoplanes nipponensis TaxID=135950 RepID=A0A919JJK8_9ACTN|nr:hypothetical protein Ani05nite_54920 [Actinoplanes nipponensis]
MAPGASAPVTPSGSVSTATSEPPAPSPSGPYNSVPAGPPPSRPAGIPKTPTDTIPSPGWVEGTVTRGGTGPCYGLVTFDGVAYAMHSTQGVKLAQGEHIRAELTPAKARIACGEGIPVSMGGLQRFP